MTTEFLPLIQPAPAPGDSDRPSCAELTSATGERLPLKAISVETAIVGMTATSTVRQRFANTGDTAIEATYVFPLPARAGVTDFTATLGGRRVVGVLKERGRAREDYEQALAAGQRAAIAEEDRADVFSVRVGNLLPGEEATVEMLLTGPLAFEDGEATFRFPLVVAPRYTTGTPLPGDRTGAGEAPDTDAVPDASRVTPPRLADDDDRPDLQISLSLDSGGLPVSGLRASLPTTVAAVSDVAEPADGLTRLRVQPGERADRDFVLRFRVGGDDRDALSSCALLVPDADGDEGTWSVTVLPPAERSSTPRDVVVVLDRSGSMGGWKMVAARRAAGRIVDMLDGADRFAVLAFDDRIDTPDGLPSGLVEASDRNRFAAAAWLGSLESRGGTEMAQPLCDAARLLSGAGDHRQAAVVLVTDGQITGEDQLLKMLSGVIGRTRVYCVGVDRAVNAGFLDRLATLGTGRAELVESEERLDEAMARLARTIGRPALTEIRVGATGLELVESSVTPHRPPDAFAGVPCVISGRYRGRPGDSAALEVSAGRASGASGPSGPFRAVLPARPAPDAAAVRTIWARAIVRDLEDAYAAGADDPELTARLVAHSIRFGVLSRFTGFVAVDPEHTEAGPLTEVLQPVEEPSGWAHTGSFPMAAMAAPPALSAQRMGSAFRSAMRSVHPRSMPAEPAAPRSLKDLLDQVEQGIGLDEALRQLIVHRDTATDPDLRDALTELCDRLSAYLHGATGPASNTDLLAAVDAVRRLTARRGRRPARKPRFWE